MTSQGYRKRCQTLTSAHFDTRPRTSPLLFLASARTPSAPLGSGSYRSEGSSTSSSSKSMLIFRKAPSMFLKCVQFVLYDIKPASMATSSVYQKKWVVSSPPCSGLGNCFWLGMTHMLSPYCTRRPEATALSRGRASAIMVLTISLRSCALSDVTALHIV